MAKAAAVAPSAPTKSGRRRERRRGTRDRLVIWAMVLIPTVLVVWLVWLPALASVYLSFTKWNGFKLSGIQWIGTKNYVDIATIYPAFWPAIQAQPDLAGLPLRAAHAARDAARRDPRP